MKVKKQYLLLIACLVWAIAGGNVMVIGLKAYVEYLTPTNIVLSIFVFSVFQIFVFGKLVTKHRKRILNYTDEKQYFIKFFDVKSFIIMAVMITGGIWLRRSGIAPDRFIAVFYTGLGASLLLAGILFGTNFIKVIKN